MSGEARPICWIAVFERPSDGASVLQIGLPGFSKEED